MPRRGGTRATDKHKDSRDVELSGGVVLMDAERAQAVLATGAGADVRKLRCSRCTLVLPAAEFEVRAVVPSSKGGRGKKAKGHVAPAAGKSSPWLVTSTPLVGGGSAAAEESASASASASASLADPDGPRCRYHSGHFKQTKGDRNIGGGFPEYRWSCCQDLDSDAPGCRAAVEHLEDVVFTASLAQFPLVAADSSSKRRSTGAPSSSGAAAAAASSSSSSASSSASSSSGDDDDAKRASSSKSSDESDADDDLSGCDNSGAAGTTSTRRSRRKGKKGKKGGKRGSAAGGSAAGAASSSDDSAATGTSTEEEDRDDAAEGSVMESDDDPLYLHYRVQASDTLQGLALRFGVSAADIQRANRTTSREVFMFKTLLIPKKSGLQGPAPIDLGTGNGEAAAAYKRQMLERKLATQASIDRFEAKFYLESTNYSYRRALRAYERDEASVTTKSFSGSTKVA